MNIKETTSDFIKQSKRVLKVARKPDREGVIGFVIVLLGQLLGL